MIYKADLHIHSVLSPCADLEMSPINIINKAKERKLDIIGLTDHNSTKQCKVCCEIGEKNNIFVLCGAEVTTKEEVHCLTFFENFEKLFAFQKYIDIHLPKINNDVQRFGYQLIVDEDENIIDEEEFLLHSALDVSIDALAEKVHELNGLFIPAHVNRPKFSLISQLGFIPPDIKADAFEISKHLSRADFYKQYAYLKNKTVIQNSDAHFIDAIGETYTEFDLQSVSFSNIAKALQNIDNNFVLK